ncbi:MAG TPA: questin oxidase family protein [Polyangiaceae bacterium]|nr:questin oxidase family protein [Polyangiaceae bacterium]
MTASHRPPRSSAPGTDRRGWFARVLAGVAGATFAAPARGEEGLAAARAPGVESPAPRAAGSPSTAPRADVLGALLQRNHGLRPDYRGGLSNHVSMALYALSAMGASAAQLERFAEAHWSRLEPLPAEPGPRVDAGNWTAQLGQREGINGYRALFTSAIARDGRDATLRKYLPGLLPGIGAAAFHPLIRTGYGVRFGDDREVADGLAYWATSFLPLGTLGRAGSERDPRVLLARVNETRSLAGRELPGYLINGKMKAASELPAFASVVDALAPSDTTLAALAGANLRLYLVDGDFTALHAVTGTHAYRMLQPFIAPPELGLRYFWQALVAAYISIGAPRVVDPAASEAPAWRESLSRATASLDEHDIKLVDVAREQGAFYNDALYRRAAARRLGLV